MPHALSVVPLHSPELSADADLARLLLQGKRYMLPNTTMMMHHPSGVARGQASDIQNEAKELLRVRNYVNTVLSVATDQPVERVRPDCKAGRSVLYAAAAGVQLKMSEGCPLTKSMCCGLQIQQDFNRNKCVWLLFIPWLLPSLASNQELW